MLYTNMKYDQTGKLWCTQLLPSMARTQLPLKNKVFLFHQQLFRKLDMTIHNIITANYHNDFYIIIPIHICIYFLKTGLKNICIHHKLFSIIFKYWFLDPNHWNRNSSQAYYCIYYQDHYNHRFPFLKPAFIWSWFATNSKYKSELYTTYCFYKFD